MIIQLTKTESNAPIYINTDHVVYFQQESRGTTLHLIIGEEIIVTEKADKVFQDYCSQKMAYR